MGAEDRGNEVTNKRTSITQLKFPSALLHRLQEHVVLQTAYVGGARSWRNGVMTDLMERVNMNFSLNIILNLITVFFVTSIFNTAISQNFKNSAHSINGVWQELLGGNYE